MHPLTKVYEGGTGCILLTSSAGEKETNRDTRHEGGCQERRVQHLNTKKKNENND